MRWGGGIYNAMRSAQVYGLGMDSGDVPGLEGESGLSCLALRWEEALRGQEGIIWWTRQEEHARWGHGSPEV